MIEIPLRKSEHGAVRIASSSLWESLGSIGLLASHRGLGPWPYVNWAKNARRSLNRSNMVVPGWLLYLCSACGGTLPSFLSAVPFSTKGDLEEEIELLRAVSPTRVRAELEQWFPQGIPAEVAPLHSDPGAAVAELCAFLPQYWRAALAPFAAPLRAATEEEILLRARVLATQGQEKLFDSLHGRLTWRDDLLRLDVGTLRVTVPDVSRLVIVPLLFGRGASFFTAAPDGTAALSYQAKGAAVLVGEAPPDRRSDVPSRGDRLEILLGRSRAGVVRGLVAPTTTSALAATLGLAPSTVSEHLTSLVAAGLVQRRRAGMRVLYELDGSGAALLEYLDNRHSVLADRRQGLSGGSGRSTVTVPDRHR
ncbi:helix-turn-helix transcriptional regulator [Streptomyces sp. MBT62]|uniref:ArsR/SmtB family transcription factor n=1 Tax=Streptomyces sp. MBT62 TaxID=2800410 RepID=UPI00190ADCDE|nr:winged helix-turn-helix domain-containing protein [Streptomyces sp. MBT62]MBK3568487.1 winged helix-turn-helix transcriptional regulator [Streptomyces sp. MBT62]